MPAVYENPFPDATVTVADVLSLPERAARVARQYPDWQPWEHAVVALREIGVSFDYWDAA